MSVMPHQLICLWFLMGQGEGIYSAHAYIYTGGGGSREGMAGGEGKRGIVHHWRGIIPGQGRREMI
jgi:hypothetical protein